MNKKQQAFVDTVLSYYQKEGRHNLPWRKTDNPYKILVSEMMLQQTQVDRVLPKYKAFLKAFPTVQKLADASLADVLTLWNGLGYNRRAKLLHNCAKEVVTTYGGTFPKSYDELIKLPGIGPYTAGAVSAFAFNLPVVMIETNIRTVFLYHFFKQKEDVHDDVILKLVAETLDTKKPREWYWALMDYGAYIKKEFGNQNSKSKHYTKQSTFLGSDRQIRGALLKVLITGKKAFTRKELHAQLATFEDIRIDAQLENMIREALITHQRGRYSLPS